MTAALIYSTLTVLAVLQSVTALNIPAGCTLNSGDFTCDFRNAVPLCGNDFEPPPQRLTIEEIYGTFNGPPDFFNFTNVNRTAFDMNFDATLTLKCRNTNGIGGLLTFTNTAFSEMDFYQSLTIRDCEIELLPDNAFHNLLDLNVLAFQGGYLNVIHDNAFHNILIKPDPTALVRKGELAFIDVDIIPGGFQEEVLAPLSDLAMLTISHSRFIHFLDNVFINLNKVHTLVLDDNPLTYLRQTVFRNMTALSKISLGNINWQCTCPNLWFLEDFSVKHISIESGVVCSTPRSWDGIRAQDYWKADCDVDKCDQGTLPSVNLGIVCLTYLQIAIYTMACIGFCLLLPTAIEWKRTSGKAGKLGNNGIRMLTPRRPPPRQRAPMGHARGFPAAKQATYGQPAGGMSYPAGSFA